MHAELEHAIIVDTDYFESEAKLDGMAWLFMDGPKWHVLIPRQVRVTGGVVFARPVTGKGEPGGWQWRLEMEEGQKFLLPRRHIQGFRPPLPPYGAQERRVLMLYDMTLDALAAAVKFGKLKEGVQPPHVLTLFLVREKPEVSDQPL
ncbi:MAG: hypothetical protein V4662_26945 [Verrucomicrobiota bacterium]